MSGGSGNSAIKSAGNFFLVARRGDVGLELAFGIVDQTGVAAEFQAFVGHFQLHGKIQFALQPRLDDELAAIFNRIRNPAAVRFQNFRLEQAHRVAAREAERFLDDNFVMAALADLRDRGKRFRQ